MGLINFYKMPKKGSLFSIPKWDDELPDVSQQFKVKEVKAYLKTRPVRCMIIKKCMLYFLVGPFSGRQEEETGGRSKAKNIKS